MNMKRSIRSSRSGNATSSLADQAFEWIVNAIAHSEIAPGERLKEARIARQIGISRGTLREAVNRLEGKKIVERKRNLGVRVRGLSRRDLDELFTVREALEGLASRLAATALSEAELDQLGNLLDRHGEREELRKGTGYYQASEDEDFHFQIVHGSRNGRLIRLLCDDLYYQIRIYRYRSSTQPGRAWAAYEEHRNIVTFLRARDPDAAETAMRHHIANARANLIWTEDTPDSNTSVMRRTRPSPSSAKGSLVQT